MRLCSNGSHKRQNTVDFLMKWEPSRETPGFKPGRPTWRLYVQEKGKLFFESEIPHDRMDDRPWFEDGAIVECQYMTWEEPLWWKPLKRRTDKNSPQQSTNILQDYCEHQGEYQDEGVFKL